MNKIKITKLQALQTINDAGEVTAAGFAKKLRERHLPVGGSRHAHAILVRLKRQSLVQSELGSMRIRYLLPREDNEAVMVWRKQRTVRWSITDKGIARMAYLALRTQGLKGKKAANPSRGGRKCRRVNH